MTQHIGGEPAGFALTDRVRVHVRLHGPAADGAPSRELTVALTHPATTETLWDVLVTRMPALQALRPQCALAIDTAWALPAARLHEGAVVDVIPPVSGG